MIDRTSSLNELLAKLMQIKVQRETMAEIDFICRKAAVYQAFAETQLPFVNEKEPDEVTEYICQLRAGSISLRLACHKILRAGQTDQDSLTKVRDNIREADKECIAFLDNIILLLKPDMLQAVDAAI